MAKGGSSPAVVPSLQLARRTATTTRRSRRYRANERTPRTLPVLDDRQSEMPIGTSQLDGSIANKSQLFGMVVSVNPLVAIDRGDEREPFTLPNEPQAFELAEPGSYRLRSSGEFVEDPDYITTWTITTPRKTMRSRVGRWLYRN